MRFRTRPEAIIAKKTRRLSATGFCSNLKPGRNYACWFISSLKEVAFSDTLAFASTASTACSSSDVAHVVHQLFVLAVELNHFFGSS
jgi:hypothetical protein